MNDIFAHPDQTYAAICQRTLDLLERVIAPGGDGPALGFSPDQMPVLINLNGDLLWLPADLLKFLWHTRVSSIQSPAPHFLAETGHYLWVRERLRPGMVAFDCGANLGLFSTMMANRVGPSGQVHAFEPDPGIASDLRRVLALNGLEQVQVVQAALADRAGTAEFTSVQTPDVRRESSHLGSLDHASGAPDQVQYTVDLLTLDGYIAATGAYPDLVKIDVEGAEWMVLEGGRGCLTQIKPDLVVEIHAHPDRGFDHDRLGALLGSYGYATHFDGDKTYFASTRTTQASPSDREAEATLSRLLQVDEEALVARLRALAQAGEHAIGTHLARVLKRAYTS